ncbi:MAG TPA: glycosyltransferase family 39 protein [Pyrinomonadaceae bacterium]|nr:glycosyltransferase family 39 protein [Pyrinomonadaceae bacterium]
MRQRSDNDGKLNNQYGLQQTVPASLATRKNILILSLIFLTAFGVRFINWSSKQHEVAAVQSSVVLNYKHQAQLIHVYGPASLYDASSPTSDPDLLGHPIGYPLLLSFIFSSGSDSSAQLLQILLDSLSALIIALIACELFRVSVGVIAGMMAAFAPQFSWNSILLLPDTLAALPILLALLLLARLLKRPGESSRRRLVSFALAGILIGISCWLRANALLLAPFVALLIPLFCKRGKRLMPALVLVGSALLVIAPLTIRNAVAFREFIPVSLGAGQTLIEGIADYDDGTLGLPQTDMELIRGEAETYQRPDYANSLFTPDGPARDRARVRRGLSVIRAHPFWFGSVMVRRALSMLKLERTPLRLASANDSVFATPLRMIQRLFITAFFLPLSLIGASILIFRHQFRELAVLLVVPAYYFCTQSALHTEYRYVLVVHYFLFALAAVAVYSVACKVTGIIKSRAGASPPS